MDWFSWENLHRKPELFSHEIWGFPVNFPLNQSIETRSSGHFPICKGESACRAAPKSRSVHVRQAQAAMRAGQLGSSKREAGRSAQVQWSTWWFNGDVMGIYRNQPSNFCQSVNQEVVVPERNGLVRPEEFEVVNFFDESTLWAKSNQNNEKEPSAVQPCLTSSSQFPLHDLAAFGTFQVRFGRNLRVRTRNRWCAQASRLICPSAHRSEGSAWLDPKSAECFKDRRFPGPASMTISFQSAWFFLLAPHSNLQPAANRRKP